MRSCKISKRFLAAVAVVTGLCSCSKPADYQAYRQSIAETGKGNFAEARRLAQLSLSEAQAKGRSDWRRYQMFVAHLCSIPGVGTQEKAAAYRRAIELAGADPVPLYSLYTALGGVYYAAGDFSQAGEAYEKARAAYMSINPLFSWLSGVELEMGPGAEDRLAGLPMNSDYNLDGSLSVTDGVYFRLASSLEKQGKFAQAEPSRRRILAVFEKRFGREGSAPWSTGLGHLGEIHDYIYDLADNLAAQGKLDEAEALYRRGVDMEEGYRKTRFKNIPASHEMAPRGCAGLAKVYKRQGRTQEAETYARRAQSGAGETH